MTSYDHLRPFLHASANMRWSWPSFSRKHRDWQNRLARLSGRELLHAAIYSGFDAIWIARDGYADRADDLIQTLIDAGGDAVITNHETVVIDLRDCASQLSSTQQPKELKRHADNWLHSPIVSWGKGFYEEGLNPEGKPYRWSDRASQLTVYNQTDEEQTIVVRFLLASEDTGEVSVRLHGLPETLLHSSTLGTQHSLRVLVPPHSGKDVSFEARLLRVKNAPGDSRALYFYVMDFQATYSE